MPKKSKKPKLSIVEGERPKHKKMYNFQPLNERAVKKKWNKVFCIGLNKTGTTSLHIAFQKLGLRSFHGGTYDSRIEAFSDGRYYKQFQELDKLAPGSKFILNTRDLREWIISRIKHCERGHYTPDFENDNLCDPDRIREWVQQRWDLHHDILEYFKDRPDDLLIFNVCAGEGYQKLCPFLGLARIAEKFPSENKRSHPVNLTQEQIEVIDELVYLNDEYNHV